MLFRSTREQCKDFLLGDTMTPSSAANAQRKLVAVLSEAVRDKRIVENPAKGIKVPYSAKRAELVPVTYEQLCTIEQSLPPEWRLALWLCFGCGLRIGESLAVRADSVRNGTTLRVEEQVTNAHTGHSVIAPLKGRHLSDWRDVPCAAWLLDKINAHVAEFGTEGYLFPAFAVAHIPTQRWRRRFNVGCVKAGCPDLYMHNLRHRFSSTMLDAGEPIANVAKFLGHRDINLTVMLYGHLIKESTGRAVSAADKAFSEFKGDA